MKKDDHFGQTNFSTEKCRILKCGIIAANIPGTPDKIETVELGETHYMHTRSEEPNQEFCDLYNPAGELAYSGKCYVYYTIERVTLKEIGRWTWVITKSDIMEAVEYHIELVKRGQFIQHKTSANQNLICK